MLKLKEKLNVHEPVTRNKAVAQTGLLLTTKLLKNSVFFIVVSFSSIVERHLFMNV